MNANESLYLVIVDGKVVAEFEALHEAAAWRDGFGEGFVAERVTNIVTFCDGETCSETPKRHRKPVKSAS